MGIGYGFFLADDLIGNIWTKDGVTYKNYVKEFLLIFDSFQKEALKFDLEIITHQPFDEYFKEHFFL